MPYEHKKGYIDNREIMEETIINILNKLLTSARCYIGMYTEFASSEGPFKILKNLLNAEEFMLLNPNASQKELKKYLSSLREKVIVIDKGVIERDLGEFVNN